MIFFDIDGTLIDLLGADQRAILAFQREFPEIFTESGYDFYRFWENVSERQQRRYVIGEISLIQERRERYKEVLRLMWLPPYCSLISTSLVTSMPSLQLITLWPQPSMPVCSMKRPRQTR